MTAPLRLGIHMILSRTHTGEEVYVLESEYNALAARLAEAERLLRQCEDVILGCEDSRSPPDIANDIGAFLRVTDSAPAAPIDCQHGCHVVRVGEDRCMHCGQVTGSTVSAEDKR